MDIEIKEVSSPADFKSFIRFPYHLYGQSKHWVPPLLRDERAAFNESKNPALKYCDYLLLIARRGTEVVGRVAGIINRRENEVHQLKRARFGWYDILDEEEISDALFNRLFQWAAEKGMEHIEGPMGFTNLDKAGLLIEGFDELPTIATLYNYPYYKEHLDNLGFTKSADYIEYEFTVPDTVPDRVYRLSEMISRKYGLKLVEEKSKSTIFKKYGAQFFNLVNETHSNLYGFVPFDKDQIEYYTRKFLSFIQTEFIALVVDKNDKLVGYAITMPSFSRAFQKSNGRLTLHGLYHLWKASRVVRRADLMLVGVSSQYRNKGIVALVFLKIIEAFRKRGVVRVESNPELEHNTEVHAMWKNYDYRQHKRRRSFSRKI